MGCGETVIEREGENRGGEGGRNQGVVTIVIKRE